LLMVSDPLFPLRRVVQQFDPAFGSFC
jgi:hypothetical protein